MVPSPLFDDEDEEDVDPDAEVDGLGRDDFSIPRVKRASPAPPEITNARPELDRRELCPVHGWVGRRAFQRDHHHMCVLGDAAEPMPAVEEDDDQDPDHDDLPHVQIANGRRRIRNPALRRARTVARKHLTNNYMEAEALKIDHFMSSPEYAEIVATRPKTRGDCKEGVRPCPWISCSAHLYLDVNPVTGTIKFNFPDYGLEDLRATCALDVADEGMHTLEQVGEFMNLTRERVRQVEVRGFFALRERVDLDPDRDRGDD